jgi:hypothetical protein
VHRLVDECARVAGFRHCEPLGVDPARWSRIEYDAPADRGVAPQDEAVAARGDHRRRESKLRSALVRENDARGDL